MKSNEAEGKLYGLYFALDEKARAIDSEIEETQESDVSKIKRRFFFEMIACFALAALGACYFLFLFSGIGQGLWFADYLSFAISLLYSCAGFVVICSMVRDSLLLKLRKHEDDDVLRKLYREWREVEKEISRLADERPDLETLAKDLDSRKYRHRNEAAWQERFGDLGYATEEEKEER